jgi:hypothetical protein
LAYRRPKVFNDADTLIAGSASTAVARPVAFIEALRGRLEELAEG